MSSQLKTLSWRHNGTKYHCEVGSPLHRYFESGNEPVLEITAGTIMRSGQKAEVALTAQL